ncbi:MAG: ABC transporter substrate-binding protein [Methanothrix sp.]|nr:ABC transporter substrate-binding protein [Methanothrix sp.]MDD4447939.1 ABC transporter substrate-binding protein [Methanothrix sp.]
MNKSKHLVALALISLGVFLAVSVSNVCSDESKYPLTITDSAGREVTLTKPVQRVIVLNTDSAEAVTILGASDLIVGLAEGIKDTYEFRNLKNRTSVGTWTEIDYEKIGEIVHNGSQNSSDAVVLCFVYPGKPNGVEAVSNSLAAIGGINTLGLDFYKEENLSREMMLLGSVLGKDKEAEEVLDWHDKHVAEVEADVAGLDHPKVFLEGSSKGLGDISTFGKQSGSAMLLQKAGGDNVMQKDDAYPKVDWEWVVSQNPDVIIKTDYLKSSDGMPGWSLSSADDVKALEEKRNNILTRPGAQNISAVKNNRVYVVSAQTLFGLDNVAGLQRLAKLLHPQINLHPEEVYKEYLQFMGQEDQKGRIFVYPEIAEDKS